MFLNILGILALNVLKMFLTYNNEEWKKLMTLVVLIKKKIEMDG